MSSTLRYAVQTHESTFSDSLLSNLPVAPPIIELVVAPVLLLPPLLLLLLLAIDGHGDAVTVTANGTALLLLLELLPATAAVDAVDAALDLDAPLNLAQLNLSPQLPFLDLADDEDDADVGAALEPACLPDC